MGSIRFSIIPGLEITYDKKTSVDAALMLRKAFFVDAEDIGNLDVLCGLVKSSGLDRDTINTAIHDGSAMAALMGDYKKAQQQSIKRFRYSTRQSLKPKTHY